MIPDLVNKVKSSEKYQRMVSNYLLSRDDTYMRSLCRKRLEKRYKWLKASLDGAYSPNNAEGYVNNSWLPSLIFPMVREMYYMVRGMTMKNFRQDPLITLEPMYETPFDNSLNAQIALNTNFKRTQFRSKCFERVIDDVARVGLGVTFSGIVRTEKPVRKTVDGPFGPSQQMIQGTGRTNVLNTRIHPLNYAQDPDVVDPDDSSWKRIIDSIPVSRLMAMVKQNPDMFIKKTVDYVIKTAKGEIWENTDKWKDDETNRDDLGKSGIDFKHFYSKLWILGNEDDDTDYIISMVEDKVVGIEENMYDDAICPIQTFRMRRRPEYYWGNTPSEDNLGHEKFMHILMNMTAQNAVQALERYVFYDKNAFSMEEMLNARSNMGFIPVEMKSNLQIQNMIYDYQPRDVSTSNIDWVAREVKESVQKSAFKPDFLRSGNKGGLANNTATAASILDETSNVLESDCMEVFGYDVCGLGKINTTLLQMFLGDFVKLPVNPKQTPVTIMKSQLLGDFDYNIVSSIHKNRVQEVIRLQNAITQILNYKGTADPTWANFNLVPIVKKWIKQLDVGDPDTLLPEQQQIPMQPGMMQPGIQPPGNVISMPPPQGEPEQVYA